MVNYIKPGTLRRVGRDLRPSLEATHYRHVLSHFATGVTVITSSYQGQPVGFTVNSFCSVSLEPMLVSFCASNSSGTWPLIKAAGNFCVNILSENQREVCATFTRKGAADRFLQTNYRLSASGLPVINGILAWIECSIETVLPAGDHVIVLGQVYNLERVADNNPLVWSKGRFGTFIEKEQIPAGERQLP